MEKRLEPIKEERTLMRDPDSNAVLNTDDRSLTNYRKKKERNRKIDRMESEIQEVRDQMKEIKAMLGELITR